MPFSWFYLMLHIHGFSCLSYCSRVALIFDTGFIYVVKLDNLKILGCLVVGVCGTVYVLYVGVASDVINICVIVDNYAVMHNSRPLSRATNSFTAGCSKIWLDAPWKIRLALVLAVSGSGSSSDFSVSFTQHLNKH